MLKAHQVLHNRESSAMQYAVQGRLRALGWSKIEVIDDDLGRLAAGGVQAIGHQCCLVSHREKHIIERLVREEGQ